MGRVRDAWYLRLPGGQEIKAKSTAAVIHHIDNGTIPKTSLARRSRDDEWIQLEWHIEFTETVTGKPALMEPSSNKPAAPPPAVSTRLDPMRLRTVGVRGLIDDLIAALDATFTRDKILVAAVASGLIGLIWGLVPWLAGHVLAGAELTLNDRETRWLVRGIRTTSVFASIIVLAWANGLLAHMTHLELSHMHRVTWRSALRGFSGQFVRLALGYLIVLGGAFLLMSFLHWLPNVLFSKLVTWGIAPGTAEVLPIVLSVVGTVLEVLLWLLLVALTWLLAPAMIGENYLLFPGLREWLGLIRSQFRRILLAEMLTLAVGILIAVPILAPIDYALSHYPFLLPPLRTLAYGLAFTGLLAFLAVANVFIYLDVNYEHAEL
jgi:hypothetical protein